tara:strand:+ start:7247 stop:8455 length:1209 start_codon:yes stop_codon:yes gene_type:complete
MSEQLFIRLGWRAEQACQWLVYSDTHQQTIASGTVPAALELDKLQEYAEGRTVTALVSASAMQLTSVEMPEKAQRQALKTIPFLLEDQVVAEISSLHFVVGARNENDVQVGIVADDQMEAWVQWLAAAGLKVKAILPDCLAVPLAQHEWAALQIEEQWLFRMGPDKGMTVDKPWLSLVAERVKKEWADDERYLPEITAYTPVQEDFPWQAHESLQEQPMLTLAKGAPTVSMNLLTGQYLPKRELGKNWLIWRNPLIFLGVFLLVSMLSKAVNIVYNDAATEEIKQQIMSVYNKVKPDSKMNVNLVKKDMTAELARLESAGQGGLFFDMLEGIQKSLHQFAAIQVDSMKFDANRREFVLQIQSVDYATIESFENQLSQKLDVKSGAMNTEGSVVSGKLVIKEL